MGIAQLTIAITRIKYPLRSKISGTAGVIRHSLAFLRCVIIVKFSKFISLQLQFAFSSSFAIGLVATILILFSGGVEGTVSLDIDLSYSDILWFLLGIPVVVTSLFLLFTPLSFFVHAVVSRVLRGNSSRDS